MTIKYDEPFEVTEQQYNLLVYMFPGIIAHRKSEGKFFIKVWLTKYSEQIIRRLNFIGPDHER